VFDATGINIAALLLRVIIGVTIFAHGYNHVWGGGKIEGTARWFASLGMKPGIVHAWLASLTELVCGPLLIIGLLNPLAAAGVVGVMAVAFITNHRPNGFFIFRPGEGYEYVLNLGVAALALGALGAGEWSLDKALFSGELAGIDLFGPVGLAITAVAGLGGAALLLAGFWRPEPKAAEGS
jgi:putative oxidoreductase